MRLWKKILLESSVLASLSGLAVSPAAAPAYSMEQAQPDNVNIYRKNGIKFEYQADSVLKEKGIIGTRGADCEQGEISVKSQPSELYVFWINDGHNASWISGILGMHTLKSDGTEIRIQAKEEPLFTVEDQYRVMEMGFRGIKGNITVRGFLKTAESSERKYVIVFVSPNSREETLAQYNKLIGSFETYPCD